MQEQKIITPSENPLGGAKTPSSPAAPNSSLTLTVPPHIRGGLESVKAKFPFMSLTAIATCILHGALSALKSEGLIRDFDSEGW